MRLAVTNLKGGSGKTTTALHLAAGLGAIVVDADPQGSALAWADAVTEDQAALGVQVVHLPDEHLAERLPQAEKVVIDCSPRDHRITDAAVRAADLAVIPTAPSAADMDRTWATLDLCTRLETPAAVLLVRVRPGTRSLAAALDAFAREGVKVLRARIPQREALALAWGQPIDLERHAYGYDQAASELIQLVKETS